MRTPPNVVDLFAGAGGLSLGAELAGAEVVFANDSWPSAAETFSINKPQVEFHLGPVQELDAKTILSATRIERGEIDILLGGPPCQGFSIYAPVRNPKDPRNSLILEYLRIVEGLYPKYLVMENVPGLLSLGRGRALQAVYERLVSLGYDVRHRVLLAAWYGVPQERWRLIIIGRRRDMPMIGFPRPTHKARARANFTGGSGWARAALDTAGLQPVTVADAIDDLPSLPNGGGINKMPMATAKQSPLTDFQLWAREGASELWNHVAPRLHRINLERLAYVRPGGSWRDIPHRLLPDGMKRARRSDHTKRYGRLDPRGLACTILTKCDPHWGSFFHYCQDRAITPREAARLQSFPDRWVFTGTQVSQFVLVGNAVPPLLAKAVIEPIVRTLRGEPVSLTDEPTLFAEVL